MLDCAALNEALKSLLNQISQLWNVEPKNRGELLQARLSLVKTTEQFGKNVLQLADARHCCTPGTLLGTQLFMQQTSQLNEHFDQIGRKIELEEKRTELKQKSLEALSDQRLTNLARMNDVARSSIAGITRGTFRGLYNNYKAN